MTNSTASKTLTRARFFLEQAEVSGPAARRAFKYYLETAIVYGRSVTFHLQKEFRHYPGFDEWYAEKQDQMREDPLCEFFKDKRNYILKEGPIPVRKTIGVAMSEGLSISDFVEVHVTRARPWYRRSPRIWLQDIKAVFIRPLHRWRYEKRLGKDRKQRQQLTRSETRQWLHFEEPKWQDRPATEVLEEYLSKLEPLVEDAESRFSEPEGS